MDLQKLKQNFIELEGDIDPKIEQPASYVRKSFVIRQTIQRAELIITALGVYDGYINGKKLGDQILTPGYTDYRFRLQYQFYDITDKLQEGENVIAAIVGDGWYRGCIDIGSRRNSYGNKIKLLCCLTLHYANGSKEQIISDESFKVSQDQGLRQNNLKTIEVYDARKENPGWMLPGFNDSAWHPASKSVYEGELIPQEGELILEHEHFRPAVLHTPDGRTVLDMGQNFAGHVAFTLNAKSGDTVSLTMGEVLDENGNFTMKNLVAEGSSAISGEVGQKLMYTAVSGRQHYCSRFLISGFRYVLLEDWPEEVRAENFEGIAVYSDFKETGNFTCSNELINQLVRNVKWSQKSNFVDIPGDCPTRERSGWTADISIFSETACYLSNPRKFLKKWLKDYQLEQSEDGNLPYIVQSAVPVKKDYPRGCMGWSNAICNISMVLYQFYGDIEDLQDVYDCVRKFVDFCTERAKKKNLFFFYKTGKHRKYIIETGFHYGEWLEPGRPMYKDFIKDMFYPDTEVTTAWFYQTTVQLVQMASLLGKADDQKKYQALADAIYQAYHKEFIKDAKVSSKRQCRYVRPIAMDLVNDEEKRRIAADLNEMCIRNQYRIGTGFLTTYRILDVLADNGYVETAYRMLENTERPGWLYAVTKGATTSWESWDGRDENDVPVDSHNHYAPGSVVAWLFSHAAGIRSSAPGFKVIEIRPVPGGSLTFIHCSYESAQGMIRVDWELHRDRNEFKLKVQVPEGVPTTVTMPNGDTYQHENVKDPLCYTCPWSI